MLSAAWKKNDRKAWILILTFSIIIFAAVSALGRSQLNLKAGFDPRIFAQLNAIINSIVALLLFCGLVAVRNKKFLHLMNTKSIFRFYTPKHHPMLYVKITGGRGELGNLDLYSFSP